MSLVKPPAGSVLFPKIAVKFGQETGESLKYDQKIIVDLLNKISSHRLDV